MGTDPTVYTLAKLGNEKTGKKKKKLSWNIYLANFHEVAPHISHVHNSVS